MLFNITLARTLVASRIAQLPLVAPVLHRLPYLGYHHYSSAAASATTTMSLPAATAPDTPTVPGQGPPKIHLYTQGTPNGYKASLCLEEMRIAYPDKAKDQLSYDIFVLDFGKNEQKLPAFLKINPNGRIPAIVDDNAGGQRVFETASILLWIAEQYDTDYKLSFKDAGERADMVSWIFFAHGGIGPMQGQAGYFLNQKYKDAFAIRRYVVEVERLFSVLEDGLQPSAPGGGSYLVGNKYSFADLNAWTWVSSYGRMGIDMAAYPQLAKWVERVREREGTKRGLKVPRQRVEVTPEQAAEKAKEVKAYIAEADKLIASL